VPSRPRIADIELALKEVSSARSILCETELHREPAFSEYLTSIDSALKAYEGATAGSGKEMSLAAALAGARNALLDGTSRLSSWIAVVRSSGFADAFASVPARFIEPPSNDDQQIDLLANANVETWIDLDSLEA
jgi:hypothetical protein